MLPSSVASLTFKSNNKLSIVSFMHVLFAHYEAAHQSCGIWYADEQAKASEWRRASCLTKIY